MWEIWVAEKRGPADRQVPVQEVSTLIAKFFCYWALAERFSGIQDTMREAFPGYWHLAQVNCEQRARSQARVPSLGQGQH